MDDTTVRRSAMLIDLENILHTDEGHRSWLHGKAAAVQLARCRHAAVSLLQGQPDRILAVSGAHLMRCVAFLPQLLDVSCRVVRDDRNAADLRLLEDAEHLARIGFTRFVIASGDHIFADFAAAHETYVIARPRALARRLRRASIHTSLLSTPPASHRVPLRHLEGRTA